MHHGTENDELNRLLQADAAEKKLGATGEFPGGPLTKTDQGEIAFSVSHYHGRVLLNFSGPVAWLGFSPQQARALALILRQHANQIERSPQHGQPRHR